MSSPYINIDNLYYFYINKCLLSKSLTFNSMDVLYHLLLVLCKLMLSRCMYSFILQYIMTYL